MNVETPAAKPASAVPPPPAAPAAAPQQTPTNELAPTMMRVRKRNGNAEPVDLNKIVRAVSRCCVGLPRVDALRVATKTISGLYDGATTQELDSLSIQTAAALIVDEPEYARLVGPPAGHLHPEGSAQPGDPLLLAVGRRGAQARAHRGPAAAVRPGQRAQAERRHRSVAQRPVRVLRPAHRLRPLSAQAPADARGDRDAAGLLPARGVRADGLRPKDAIELYRLFSSLEYLPSSPTLFNAGTRHEQLSSCFLLDSPADELEAIYKKYTDVAMLSKFSGGIGVAYHRVRSRGSLIKSTNGHSNGIVPWLKTLDASVAAVNQGGKRKGACCVYLETWHADIEDFLELRDNTGDEARRTHNLNLANWVPDLFMTRVEQDGEWSLFDPKATAAPDGPVRRGLREGVRRGRGQGPGGAQGEGAGPVRAHDEDAGADG